VNFRVTAVGAVPKPAFPRWTVTGALEASRRAERSVVFGGARVPTPVYQRDRLPGGVPFPGPAIVEELGATTVIPPGWTATVGARGELVLARVSV
jgi:N-methylhydantoinase A